MATEREVTLVRAETEVIPSSESGARATPELEISGVQDVELLSVGEASSLFRAFQPTSERVVAIKVLHGELTSESGQRFDRERKVTSRLSGHTGIVPLFESGVTSRDEPYLVLPFYRRGSLAGLIEDQGPVPWRGATYLLEQVAVTVTEVHGSGVIHRKIKPANILLTDFLLPRLADFDQSLAIGETVPLSTLPLSSFFSPGQAAEANTAEPAEDVYALAAVLWALLAGESRFTISGTPSSAAFAAYEATALARQGRLPGDVTAPPQPILDLIARAMSEQQPVDGAAFVTDLRRSVAEAERQRLARLPSLEPTPDPSSGTEIQTADDGRSTSPTNTAAREVRYVLMLVGCISVVILIMVAAATLAVG